MRCIDFSGKRFGRLIATTKTHRVGRIAWVCRCDCGGTKVVTAANLQQGVTQSCGCIQRERIKARCSTHGLSGRPEYQTWLYMRKRCCNPSDPRYSDYGGRGIYVHKSWLTDFAQFFKDMGPRPSPAHSIDRIDNDGPYSPQNCRWATLSQQASNKRSNVNIEVDGVTRTMAEWTRLKGFRSHLTIHMRMNRLGWTPRDAVMTPTKKPRKIA